MKREPDGIVPRAGRAKLGTAAGGVNLLFALLAAVVTGCLHPPRIVPRAMLEAGSDTNADVRVPAPTRVSVAWRKGLGRGLIAPIEANGPLLIAATTSRSVIALSAETGMQYWDRRFGSPIAGPALRGDDRVYLATGRREGTTYALSPDRGRTLWARDVGVARVAPLLLGDTLFVTTASGDVHAIAGRSGDDIWRVRLTAAATAPPFAHGRDLFVATRADTLVRIDRATGRVLASAPLPAHVSASALVRGDTLVLPLFSGDVLSVALPELRVLIRIPVHAPVLAAPVEGPGGAIYVLTRDAELWRLDGAAGPARRLAALGGAASGSLAAAANGVLVGRLDGALFLISPEGAIIWQEDLGDSIVAPVTVADGALYVPLLHGDLVKLQ